MVQGHVVFHAALFMISFTITSDFDKVADSLKDKGQLALDMLKVSHLLVVLLEVTS
jgi:hypothetical protein